jgi:sn-glycerol 3-phosphate transport system permease protein
LTAPTLPPVADEPAPKRTSALGALVGGHGAVAGPRATRKKLKDWALAAAVLIPSFLVFATFFFYPLYRLFYLGAHQQNRFGTAERYLGFTGARERYIDVLGSEEFREGLSISATYVVLTVPLGLALGTLLAVAANRRLKGIKVFQTIFASTVASSVAVASVVFFVLINPQVGYFRDVSWLSLADPDTALRGVALSSVWQNLGLSFIIVLAGLQSVPEEIYEAADLDGYGPVRRFFRITLPMISPTMMFLVVVLVIFAFQAFAQIDILTGGGPAGSTETLVYKIFNSQQPLNQSEGSIMAIGLFCVTLVVTAFQFFILDRRVHYGS